MPSRDQLEGLSRQAFPVGDAEHGQYVQPGSNFPTMEVTPDWTATQSLTVSSSSVQLDDRRLSNNYALITSETAVVRFWLDGTVPTATTGHELGIGDILELTAADELQDVQFIRRDPTDATLRVSYGNRRFV